MSPLRHARLYGALLPALFVLIACSPPPAHDVILRGGTVYDDTGGEPYAADIAIDNDSITAIGDLDDARESLEIDAEGLAVAPGFINMLSWANESLIEDGSFARVLAKYVREEKVIPLANAVRKLSGLPAKILRLDRRGLLKEDYYADVVVFDPERIQNHATFVEPHQYATGMLHVFVNGEQVLADGEHTGATPGRVVRGPGWAARGAYE